MPYNNIWIIISDDEETILSPIQIPFVPYVNTEQMRTLHSIFSRRAILIHLSPHFLTKLIKETSTNSSELFLCGSLSCPVLSSPRQKAPPLLLRNTTCQKTQEQNKKEENKGRVHLFPFTPHVIEYSVFRWSMRTAGFCVVTVSVRTKNRKLRKNEGENRTLLSVFSSFVNI